jgi:hypothetical protein
VDNTTPYPTLLGLDWVFENYAIINLKTRKMTFDSGEYRVITPLDPSEGEIFVEPTCLDLEKIIQLYRTTLRYEDYMNPTTDGVLSWQSITSCVTNSDIGLDNWKQRIHEVSTRRCTRIDCNKQIVKEIFLCYHVQEEAPDEDNLCNIQIEEA